MMLVCVAIKLQGRESGEPVGQRERNLHVGTKAPECWGKLLQRNQSSGLR